MEPNLSFLLAKRGMEQIPERGEKEKRQKYNTEKSGC